MCSVEGELAWDEVLTPAYTGVSPKDGVLSEINQSQWGQYFQKVPEYPDPQR